MRRNQHETATQHRKMVAGSSLRRPPHKSTHQQEVKANNDEEHPSLSLRSKRIRAPTLSDQDQDHKRRKLAAKRPQPLRIPLRGKAILAQAPADPGPEAPNHYQSIDLPTPTGKPQYDQIKFIEEKARKAIHDKNGASTSAQDEQRKLRKHGGTRSNIELAQYFPNFQEMLSLEPPDPGKRQ